MTTLKYCPICDSTEYTSALNFTLALGTDIQVVEHPLHKVECSNCGAIRTLNLNFLSGFYDNYKKLDADVHSTMLLNDTPLPFSELIFQWINKFSSRHKNVLEIGCGHGKLLDKFSSSNGNINIEGIEPAQSCFLNMSEYLKTKIHHDNFEAFETHKKYDLIYSVNVFEHLVNPKAYLEKCKKMLHKNGTIIIICPSQVKFNYDCVFIDHLIHVLPEHMRMMTEQSGLTLKKYENGFGNYHFATLYAISHNHSEAKEKNSFRPCFQKINNIQSIHTLFATVNRFCLENRDVVVFSYGEITQVIKTYTNLNDFVNIYIDDYKTEASLGDTIVTIEKALDENLLADKVLLLLCNPYINGLILARLNEPQKHIKVYNPLMHL